MQRLGTVHRLEPLVGVKRAGFAHEIGEVVFETGCAHAVRAGAHRIPDGTSDRTDRRFAVEPAEDVPRSEADQQAVHLRQHVCGEERDGERVTVFKVESEGFGKAGAHLFERVRAARLEP